MPKEEFKKTYNDKDLCVKQRYIKADREIAGQRKSMSEHPFGTIKRSMEAGYLLTKSFTSVIGEFSLTFFAYNLKRAISILGVQQLIKAIKSHKEANFLVIEVA